MKKFRDTDYLHASVRLRAVSQKSSVGFDTLLKIVESRSVSDAIKLLEDKGLNFSSSQGNESVLKNLDKVLTKELNDAYKLVMSIIGDSELVSLLKVKYDFQNLKALIKAEMLGVSPDSMLVDCGNISLSALKEGFRERNKKLLDGALVKVVESAVSEASETGDPQRIDIIADNACFEYIKARCENSGFDFLVEYFNAKADLTNIMISFRCKKMGKDAEFLSYVLLPYSGIVSADSIKKYYGKSEEFYKFLLSTPYRKVFENINAENLSLGKLESNVTDYLTGLVKKMNSVSFGPQVVAGYLLEKEKEVANIRIALSSVASGIDPEKAKERLRA